MEQFVLGIFQEQLSKIIVGFQKEQVNANLLNGKGEITDVSLNCSFLNEHMAAVTPYIEFESIHVGKLGFHVTSWPNLRKAPILVDIEQITVTIHEPLRFLDKKHRKSLKVLTERELVDLLVQGLYKPLRRGGGGGVGGVGGGGDRGASSSSSSSPYGFMDRIIDNLTIELKHVTIHYQTWGKFKTKRIGPWTPPCLQIDLKYLRIVSVDDYGTEGTPDQVWEHNRHQHVNFMLYKKITMELSTQLRIRRPEQQQSQQQQQQQQQQQPSSSTTQQEQEQQQQSKPLLSEIPLLKATGIEIQVAVKRRLRDGAVLSIQLDATLRRVEIEIEAHVVPLLAHLVAGFQYCSAKDRTFEDPLKEQSVAAAATSLRQESSLSSTGSESLNVDEFENEAEGGILEPAVNGDNDDDDKNENDDAQSVDSADVDEPSEIHPSSSSSSALAQPQNAPSSSSSSAPEKTTRPEARPVDPPIKAPYSSRPIILLPNGLVIYENICITLSVHHVTIRGSYTTTTTSSEANNNNNDGGYVQLMAKGLIAELIWPRENNENGCYCQLSLAYISLQERKGQRIRTILIGGMQNASSGDGHHTAIEKPTILPREVTADENFPFFERRAIRDDPLGLRYSFPSQAVGIKTIVELVGRQQQQQSPTTTTTTTADQSPAVFGTVVMVTHEIGIDKFDIVLDSDAWCRAVRFALHEDGGGFDPRWHSGDWSYCLTREMLLQPNVPLELERHLQPVKQVFLDDNLMISSDLLNVTARITNVEIRVPATVQENARSCDIHIRFKETMVIVSSALPRTFLSGKIGNAINGDDSNPNGAKIDFPNDPSDIAYTVGQGKVVKPLSTFRVQVTMRGFAVSINPVIPFCAAQEPQCLIAPADCNMIVCFEGEPPDPGSSYIKIVLFLSLEFRTFRINLDLDLLAGAASAMLYHSEVVKTTVESLKKLLPDVAFNHPVVSSSSSSSPPRVKKGLRGRRILVRRQLSRSRQTGGLSVIFGMKLQNFGITLWRQNVPVVSPFRQTAPTRQGAPLKADETSMLQLLKLIELSMKDFETGIEFAFHADGFRRVILKCCMGKGNLNVCDLDTNIGEYEERASSSQSDAFARDYDSGGDNPNQSSGHAMVNVLSFGEENLPGEATSESRDREQHFALRLEEQLKDSRQWSLACDMTSPAIINLHVDKVKGTALLIIEALLLPTWSKRSTVSIEGAPFPKLTIGAFFHSLVTDPKAIRRSIKEIRWDSEEKVSADTAVERVLRVLFKLFLPADLGLVLVRIDLGNLLICVPASDLSDDPSKCCGLLLHQSEIVFRFYPVSGTLKSNILEILACKGVAWSSLIETQEDGFYQKVSSRQSLLSVTLRDLSSTEVLVNPFDIALSYAGARIAFSMGNDLLVEDIRKVEEFVWQLLACRDNCEALHSELAAIFLAIKSSGPNIKEQADSSQETFHTESEREPVLASLRSGRRFIHQLHEELGRHEIQLRNSLEEKERQVNALKSLVFKKEKERFGALSLLASKVAGWLRMGGLHLTGDRVGKVSTMWTYWAVLRKSLLLIYTSPGEPKPVDIVTLDGAKLNALAGGSSKQDIKRGFALVERSGATRYFIAFTGPQCGVWTRELQEAILAASGNLDEASCHIEARLDDPHRPEQNEPSAVNSESNQGRNLPEVEDGTPRKRIGIGLRLAATKNRIGSALETARLKGLEVTERRRLNKQDFMDPDDGTFEAYGDNNSESEIVDRQAEFGGVQDFGLQADCLVSNESSLNDESLYANYSDGGHNEVDLTRHADSTSSRLTEENSKLLVERTESIPIRERTESMINQISISESDAVEDGVGVSVEASSQDVERGVSDQSDEASGPRRRLQFGAKLSGVRQATKTRIGSALQTARQKGAAVAERRRMDTEESVREISQHGNDSSEDRMPRTDGSESLTNDEQVASSGVARYSSEDGNLATADDTEASIGQNMRPRFGGKFAGVREATKSKIGSAIQNVRLKGKEVSERLRSDSEDVGDNLQGSSRAKLGGLLSGTNLVAESSTSRSSRNAATASDGGLVDDHASKTVLSWSCTACTFVNNSENHLITIDSCEMCYAVRPKEDQPQSSKGSVEYGSSSPEGRNAPKAKEIVYILPTDTATIQADVKKDFESSQVGNTNDGELTETGPRRGMFGGMRNVLANKTERQPPALQATDNRKVGRFAFRKRNDEMESLVDGGGSVKVKNIRTGESFFPASFPEDAKSRAPLILKRLVGDWAVLVQSGRKEYGRGDGKPQYAPEEIESGRRQCEFRICVIPVVPGPEDTPVQALCNIADIFELHTRVSESVAVVLPQIASETTENGRPDDRTDLGEMPQSLSRRLGLSSLDNVLLTGKILGGLLDFDESSEIFKKTHDYQVEVIGAFLNSILECPLTVDALTALAQFLGISAATVSCDHGGRRRQSGVDFAQEPIASDGVSKDEVLKTNNIEWLHKNKGCQDAASDVIENGSKCISPAPSSMPPGVRSTLLLGLLTACETELVRAENCEMIAQSSRATGSSQPQFETRANPLQRLPAMYEPLLPQSVTEHFQDGMHEALMKVMEERDEAHAQLIAANVLHIHELEQERKRTERLAKKLEFAEARFRATPNLPPMFMGLNLGLDEKPRLEAERKLQNFEAQAKQDSDAELLALCQQLAGEISAKTGAALEIIRLKESRDIERKNEAMEKQSLKDELKRLKEQLAEEQRKNSEIYHEKESWKQSYAAQAKEKRKDSPN